MPDDHVMDIDEAAELLDWYFETYELRYSDLDWDENLQWEEDDEDDDE